MKRALAATVLALSAAAGALSQPPPPPAAVAKIAVQAQQAREAERVDEALKLYRQAVAIAPKWVEGWWQIGTIEYGRDQYPLCRDAFRRFTALNSKLSAGFGFLGLCQFQTKELAAAISHLEKAVTLGLPNEEQFTDVVLYHLALAQTKAGNFERALQVCAMLTKKSVTDPNLIAVAGIAALRKPIFPHELGADDRDAAFRLGSTLLSVGAKSAAEVIADFDGIVRDYPKMPNVHYTYATFLLVNDPDKGLDELKKELELSPDHLPARISIAFEYLNRGRPDDARPHAEKAVAIAPGSFAAKACLGRVLLESDEKYLPEAIRQLEAATKLAPDSPQVRFSLASAYAKAGRKQDAARERTEFSRLQKLKEAAVTQRDPTQRSPNLP